jgi:pyruvate dehydrogenase E2 component (dihydrolipoyllysine-residue acetyltransferase)
VTTVREVRLPALSATMEEATLLAWNVGPGDEVKQGQPIAEVSTDKVDMDLEAPFSGVIHELLVEPGRAIALGGTLATIITDEEDLLGGLNLGTADSAQSVDIPRSQDPVLALGAGGEASETGSIVPASPRARKLARETGVDLALISPTGTRGQVTPSDVSQAAAARAAIPQPAIPGPVRKEPTSIAGRGMIEPDIGQDAKRLRVRRATVEILDRSAAIPQFTLFRTLNLDKAVGRKGYRSWTTELIRALAGTLRSHPQLNARWDRQGMQPVPFDAVRVGLAVDRPGVGLVVASIADPDLGNADEVDRGVRALAERGKSGKLRPDDLAQASITLSNLGGFGVDRFQALLFPPQPAILSAGSITMRPVATAEGALKASLTCEVGLTVDHRVADGADGARFLETYASLVENG